MRLTKSLELQFEQNLKKQEKQKLLLIPDVFKIREVSVFCIRIKQRWVRVHADVWYKVYGSCN